MNKDYTIGIYIRLSMADEDTGNGSKAESDSIGNQRMLINRYLDNHPTLSKYPRLEFADDGYTGTNFHRPQFSAMMEKVRHGEINLICVKDFSRFSRDYIETGNYLECTFPFMGVRFISINDGYDSDDYKGTTGGLEVVMRSIIYAAYSKDLSVKTTTAKIQMMKQGKYVGGYAPYGYVLHPEIRNKLKLDPEAAEVVRRVFNEALKGRNTSQIALGLNDDNIPTPGQYFKGKHPDKKKYSRMSEKISWTASMVYKILTSYVYTGATVGHKRKSGGVGSRKTISQKKEDWIIVEGMHEAIVSKEEFDNDILKGYALMAEAGIKKEDARYFIPPYEHYNSTISEWARQLGLQIINYTPGTRSNADYTTPDMKSYASSEELFATLDKFEKEHTLNGHFLMLHFGTHPARTDKFYNLLPRIIDTMQGRGYSFVTVDEMIEQ